jgi:tRNA(Ile)-lysidine synthase
VTPDVLATVQDTIRRHAMLAGGETVLVAVSGGADSTALLYLLTRLAPAWGLQLHALHVDHGLREESAREAEAVRGLGSRLGVPVDVAHVTVSRRGSLEDAARAARYAALEAHADGLGAQRIAIGHTADDQAETVLMRIIAGTGLAGLAGIPARRGRFVRPLLERSRAEVIDYCRHHAIATVDDPTNADRRHFRNRLRHDILPSLRRENVAVDRALIDLAARAGEIGDLIDLAADALAGRAASDGGWDVAALAGAPRPVAARVLARAAAQAGAGPLTARHHAALERLLRRPRGGSAAIDLPAGRAVREYGRLRFVPFEATSSDPPEPGGDLVIAGPDGPYEVRPVRPGDRMRPARLRGRSRKLSDLFIDARVPRRLRAAARVVVRPSDGSIEWAEHIGPAHGSSVRVTLTGPDALATNKSR